MRNILLALCGLAPQVITEALYALLQEGKYVHAVHVITTRQGKNQLLAGLFDPAQPRLSHLLNEFGLDLTDVEFPPTNIHTLTNSTGVEIDDIGTAEDNEDFLELCLSLAHRFSNDAGAAIWYLVAGGRKTMTSCLTLAAQLYGRQQDRLFHVLVSPDFENCRDFWYPPRQSQSLRLFDRQGHPFTKETRYAQIQLISIPFISVGAILGESIVTEMKTPADLMQSLIRETPYHLAVDLAEGKIIYGKTEMDMHPAHLALYAFFAERRKSCGHDGPCTDCSHCYPDLYAIVESSGIADMYRRIPGSRLIDEMSDSGISTLSKENFNSYKSKIRRDLLSTFGHAHIQELEIASLGTRPNTCYGLRLDRKRIQIKW
jgi:CRISPR-associated protein (TIGR02584 family)